MMSSTSCCVVGKKQQKGWEIWNCGVVTALWHLPSWGDAREKAVDGVNFVSEKGIEVVTVLFYDVCVGGELQVEELVYGGEKLLGVSGTFIDDVGVKFRGF